MQKPGDTKTKSNLLTHLASRRWILLILVLALGLRLVNLGERNLWYDEAFSVLFAEKGLDAMLYGTLTPVEGGAADIHPLLYYSTLNVWMALFGQGAFAVRFLGVLIGVATVYVMYRLGRDLFGERTGLAAALITAIVPFHVQYSQEARMYSLMGLLLLAATWAFLRAWRSDNVIQSDGDIKAQRDRSFNFLASLRISRFFWWIMFGVLAGLAMYAQQLSAFYLIAIGLVPLVARRKDQIAGMVVGTTVAVLVYLPWLVNLPSQVSKVSAYYWVPVPNAAQFLLTIRSFLSVNLDFPAPASMIAFVGALFMVAFLAVQVIVFGRRPGRRGQGHPPYLIMWLSLVPVVLMWLLSQVFPVYQERALLPAALPLYLLLAWLLTGSGLPRPIAVIVGGVGLVLVGIGLFYQYTWMQFPNSPFREAVASIGDEWKGGDVIVHQNKLSALPMIYYDRERVQRYVGDNPGSPEDTLALPTQEMLGLLTDECVAAANREGERIWFVVFAEAERQYEQVGRTEIRDAFTWLETNYGSFEKRSFNDLDVYLYADPIDGIDANCQ